MVGISEFVQYAVVSLRSLILTMSPLVFGVVMGLSFMVMNEWHLEKMKKKRLKRLATKTEQ